MGQELNFRELGGIRFWWIFKPSALTVQLEPGVLLKKWHLGAHHSTPHMLVVG
jgi:hypothetical protein